MNMENVIITGGTSFIGVNLIKKFVEKDYNIFAAVRPNSNKTISLPKSDKIRLIEVDMSDYKNLDKLINTPCDCYFSIAWSGTRGKDRDDKNMQEENYQYSIDALQAALKLGCKTVASAGSQAEYGVYDCAITENTPCKPVTEYGKYKLRFYNDAYDICKKSGVSFKEPRFFSLYGPNDSEGTMIISMIKNMLANKDCELTECVQMWDFLHIYDAVDGLIKLIEVKCADGPYNFGSGISHPLKVYVEEIYKLINSRSQLLYGKVPYPASGMVSIQPDVSKLMNETGWRPQINFTDGIKEIINQFGEYL